MLFFIGGLLVSLAMVAAPLLFTVLLTQMIRGRQHEAAALPTVKPQARCPVA